MSFAYLGEVFNSEENTFLYVMMMVVLPSFITIFLQVDGKWSALLRSRRHFTMPMLGKL